MKIKLVWEEPATGENKEPILPLPIAFGRDFNQLPQEIGNGEKVCRMILNSGEVSRYHFLLTFEQGKVWITDQKSANGLQINNRKVIREEIKDGDVIQIGPYQIAVNLINNQVATPVFPSRQKSIIGLNPDPQPPNTFPPEFFQQPYVDPQAIHGTGLPVTQATYGALGGGLGSYIWVDLLRISGIKAEEIKVLGMEGKPYERYKRLCLNSQIPLHERLRSNSDSCPDNIWGFPSYAIRESFNDLLRGHFGDSLKLLWQVFAEPTFAETYTPKAGEVFNSIDREAARIGWGQMFNLARIRAIRKTTDGRYVVAYSRKPGDHAFLIANYLHIAIGYPALQFLQDLQAYREQTKDFKRVVNAYEDHEHVYQELAQYGGKVLIRGRGIVASRILQKIYEVRKENRHVNITVLHLLRSAKPEGNKFRLAQRKVENHYEFQPFNWPKACWGGELKALLETATPDQRKMFVADWGGTTTANRQDWRKIVSGGLSIGWYQVNFGEVEKVEPNPHNNGTISYIKTSQGNIRLEANFIIDATGLDAHVTASPLLDDLVKQYDLPLNYAGRLTVSRDFEISEMSNQNGRVYAAGTTTFGNFYAPVDSFLGLQYACLSAVQNMVKTRTQGVKSLNIFRSLSQWWKWMANQPPN